MLTPDKIIEIFVKVDDFCKEFDPILKNSRVETDIVKTRNRSASLSDSEVITLLIAFHSGHFTNLKHFYLNHICPYYKAYFPGLVSYNRFVELQQRVAVPMMLFLKTHCLGASRGINFIDSTHIKVCHNRRIHNHKVFTGVAERGQCSLGWFFGFKLHLIINDQGEILSFYLTKGNVDDRNVKLMTSMTQDIFGKLFGDKGYISKALADLLWGNGIQMITKPRKNMKEFNISQADKIMLRKRAIIECVNDELKNICKLQHTRHRSVNNFLMNTMGALCAYHFFPKKPSLNIVFETPDNQLLLAA
ncbi:MAG: IS982 family transposase [Mucilaginibacter sp.]|uniref:IS982 family transposase n=1 Tax=Mucilaginibacter sp. TaxID=1882438 RepID=UPI0032633E68